LTSALPATRPEDGTDSIAGTVHPTLFEFMYKLMKLFMFSYNDFRIDFMEL
jgi:hypothetical protein